MATLSLFSSCFVFPPQKNGIFSLSINERSKKKKCLCPMNFSFSLPISSSSSRVIIVVRKTHQGVSFDSVWRIQWIMVFTVAVSVIAVSHQLPPVKVCVLRMKRIQRWKKEEKTRREWGCLEGTHVTGNQWWKGHKNVS